MTAFIERIEKLWCETMHSRTMWPIHGKYRCGECLREYPVEFLGPVDHRLDPPDAKLHEIAAIQ